MFILFFVIVAAVLVAMLIGKLIRPILIVAALMFAWVWLSDNVHWGSYGRNTSTYIPPGVVTQDRPLER